MDPKSLETALAGLGLGPVYYMERTGSTNTDAARLAAEGAPDLSLVVANEQTAGRGRLDRRWITPPGSALAMSLLLRPTRSTVQIDPSRWTGLGAVALCLALETLYGLQAEIKWPNDVLLHGRKVAGILAEAQWVGSQLSGVILGIGVNVLSGSAPLDKAVLYPATSVEDAGVQPPPDRLDLLRALLDHLLAWRPRLDEAEFLQAWDERLAFRGQWIRVSPAFPGAPDVDGQVLGLNASGALRLRLAGGFIVEVNAGEVHLRPAP